VRLVRGAMIDKVEHRLGAAHRLFH
jgi:hypothetical protein